VSTQVVEAGVDLDFSTVYRAEAPLDSIIQAAGRCNREGRLATLGRVVVFRPPDDASPNGVYRAGRDIVRHMLNRRGFDPNDPATVARYFEWLSDVAVNPDEEGIQSLRTNYDFPAVAHRFRMIPDGTYDIIVDYPESSTRAIEALVEQLRTRERSPREILRRLQQYFVSLRAGEAERLRRKGLIEEFIPGVGRWHGAYDRVRGITDADPEHIV